MEIQQTYLSVKEVAKRLNISEATVWRLIRDGELPRHKFGTRTTRIHIEDLLAFEHRGKTEKVAARS